MVDSISGDTTFLPPADFEYLQLMLKSGTTQQLGQPLMLETNLPLAEVDTAGVHFDIKVDTIWQPLEFKLRPDSLNPLLRSCIDVNWKPGEKYRISVDTMAMRSIYGPFNKPMSQEITVKQLEDYANLNVTLVDLDSVPAVVELLNSSDAPQYRAIKPVGESVVRFKLLAPGTYYMRLFIDENQNGKWDTGNPVDSLQPEEVYYFAKKLDLKKNWDVDQDWDITELPLDRQKPYAIKKNRPKLKRGEKAPEEEKTEEDDYYYDPFGEPNARDSRRNLGTFGR